MQYNILLLAHKHIKWFKDATTTCGNKNWMLLKSITFLTLTVTCDNFFQRKKHSLEQEENIAGIHACQ